MQTGSGPELPIAGKLLLCKNTWKAVFAEEISPCFATPPEDILDSLPHLVTRWPSGLSPCLSCCSGWMPPTPSRIVSLDLSLLHSREILADKKVCLLSRGWGMTNKRSNTHIYKWGGLCGSSYMTKNWDLIWLQQPTELLQIRMTFASVSNYFLQHLTYKDKNLEKSHRFILSSDCQIKGCHNQPHWISGKLPQKGKHLLFWHLNIKPIKTFKITITHAQTCVGQEKHFYSL